MACPVQKPSKCSREKDASSKTIYAKGVIPEPETIPRLYCSIGVAACKDLDLKQECVCSVCPVWNKHGLKEFEPKVYYCKDGYAR